MEPVWGASARSVVGPERHDLRRTNRWRLLLIQRCRERYEWLHSIQELLDHGECTENEIVEEQCRKQIELRSQFLGAMMTAR